MSTTGETSTKSKHPLAEDFSIKFLFLCEISAPTRFDMSNIRDTLITQSICHN